MEELDIQVTEEILEIPLLTEAEKIKMQREFECCVHETHEGFLRTMYPYFGLKKSPPPIRLNLDYCFEEGLLCEDPQGYLIQVSFDKPTAKFSFQSSKEYSFDSWKEWLMQREMITAHETAHYCHAIANPLRFKLLQWEDGRKNKKGNSLGRNVCETAAQLASIMYMQQLEHLNSVLGWASTNTNFHPAWEIFKSGDLEKLTRLVTSDLSQAYDEVTPYVKFIDNYTPKRELFTDLLVHEC